MGVRAATDRLKINFSHACVVIAAGSLYFVQNVFYLGVPNVASRLGISQCQKCGD